MNLTIEIRNVYGNELVYPICDKAKKLCSLTGQKTFNKYDISTLKSLGYTFTQNKKEL